MVTPAIVSQRRLRPARPPLDGSLVTGGERVTEAAFDVVFDGEVLLQVATHTGAAEVGSTNTSAQYSALSA